MGNMYPKYDRYDLGEINTDRVLVNMFLSALSKNGYHATLITMPPLTRPDGNTSNRTPYFGRHKHVVTISNVDGKLIAILHKYGLTSYVFDKRSQGMRLSLDFPSSTCKINKLLASEKF